MSTTWSPATSSGTRRSPTDSPTTTTIGSAGSTPNRPRAGGAVMRFVRELEVTYRRLPLGDNSPWIGSKIASSRDVSSIFRSARIFDGQIDESCWIVMVAGDNRVLGLYRISEGGPTDAGVYPAKVFRGAVLVNAAAVILAHNHPSGETNPSAGDRAVTEEFVRAGEY